MIIGIDASRANRQKKTGTEWYAYHIIQELKKIDSNNQYILYSNEKLSQDLAKCPENWQVKILSWPFKYIWTHFRLSWEMLVNPPDILFVPAHSVPLIHRGRTIVTIHDLGFLHNSEIYHPLARIYHQFSAWWSVRKAKKIITISEYSKKDIIKIYDIPETKIVSIPLGINKKNFYPIDDRNQIDKVKKKFNITKKYFFYIGRLEKKKNIPFLLKTWLEFERKFIDYELVLAGHKSFGSDEIDILIDRANNVKILGYVDVEYIPGLMSGAEAFIFPSLFEGFGLPLLEAMACGCPVISSNSTSLPEVGSDAALYFNPDDPGGLLELMENVITDKELKQMLVAKGLARASKYSWQQTAYQIRKTLVE